MTLAAGSGVRLRLQKATAVETGNRDGDGGEDRSLVASCALTAGFLWLRQSLHNLDARIGDVVETHRRILRQTPLQKLAEPPRSPGGKCSPRRLPLEYMGDGVRDRLAQERRAPGQGFEETATE